MYSYIHTYHTQQFITVLHNETTRKHDAAHKHVFIHTYISHTQEFITVLQKEINKKYNTVELADSFIDTCNSHRMS